MKGYFGRIGEVVSRLSWEYRDMTAATIRFWEKEGLILPPERSEGGRRLYTEEDVNWIRLVKELSLAGLSIQEMRKRVTHVRQELNQLKEQQGARDEAISYFIRTVEIRRRRNVLDRELEEYDKLDGEQRNEKVFDRQVLAYRMDIKSEKQLIEKAEQYGLVIPKKVNGMKRYSSQEEMILKLLAFMEFLKPGSVDRCKDLVATIQYLVRDMGILEGFQGSRKHAGTTGYNATLYTLVMMNLDRAGLLD